MHLHQVVQHVADEHAALALALELEHDMAGRMTGSRRNLDEVIETARATADDVGLAGVEDRHDALTEGAELSRSFFRVGIDLGEVIDVRL